MRDFPRKQKRLYVHVGTGEAEKQLWQVTGGTRRCGDDTVGLTWRSQLWLVVLSLSSLTSSEVSQAVAVDTDAAASSSSVVRSEPRPLAGHISWSDITSEGSRTVVRFGFSLQEGNVLTLFDIPVV